MKRFFTILVALFLMLASGILVPASAEVVSSHPLLAPQELKTISLAEPHTNILLLGIDFGFPGYLGSGNDVKTSLKDCHTDAIMVVSINMTTGETDLISFPRDTLTYVPGARGIYKLNGAFNCSSTLEEGFQRVCNAVSWLLGGIPIDHYCAVDMGAMIALGDFVGGVEMEVEMTYDGSSGFSYNRGFQHLNGTGMMDYVRARKNATANGTDLGRTNRQRQAITALFHKVRTHPDLIEKAWEYANGGAVNFHTNLSLDKILQLLNAVQATEEVGSHVMDGKLLPALASWNFHFVDQAHRKELIQAVYGIEVPELPGISYRHTEWLVDTGFATMRAIGTADQVLCEAAACTERTAKQQAAVDELQDLYERTIRSFEIGAIDIHSNDAAGLIYKRQALRDAAEQVIALFDLDDEQITWRVREDWYNDPILNEYQFYWQ